MNILGLISQLIGIKTLRLTERYDLALRFVGIAEEDLNARFAVSIMHSGFFYSRSGPPWMSLPSL